MKNILIKITIIMFIIFSGNFLLKIPFSMNLKNNEEEWINIRLNNSNEFIPVSHGKNDAFKVYSKSYIFGNQRLLLSQTDNNAKFVFDLDEEYDYVSINQHIAVNGLYDEYYSELTILGIPVPGNVLTRSTEVFSLKGKVGKGQTKQVSNSESVATIVDMWGKNNFGYQNVSWYMSLNDVGNKLTIYAKGNNGYHWGSGNMAWKIGQMRQTEQGYSDEVHEIIGNGAPYMHLYPNSSMKYVPNPYLDIKAKLHHNPTKDPVIRSTKTSISKNNVTINYSISGSVDKVFLKDEQGNIKDSSTNNSGTLFANNLSWNETYKAWYVQVDGNHISKTKVLDDFTTEKKDAKDPIIISLNSYVTGGTTADVNYLLYIPSGDGEYCDTVINSIVVQDDSKIYGLQKNDIDPINERGVVNLGELNEKTKYSNLYVTIYYNDNKVFNKDGLLSEGKVPEFTTF